MRRFVPWVLAVLSIAIVVVALAELSNRDTTTPGQALPTGRPSPTFAVPMVTTPAPVTTPPATIPLTTPPGVQQQSPAPTVQQPTPRVTQQSPVPTFRPSSPAPGQALATPGTGTGAGTRAQGPTPVSGGGAVPGGLLVIGLASIVRRLTAVR